MTFLELGKYRTIVISIVLFLVIDAGVLVMNFYMANRIAKDTVTVNLAGRQRTLSQQSVKALLQTDNALGSGNFIDEPLQELKHAYEMFDTTLSAFRDGGTVEGADGKASVIAPIETKYGRKKVAEAMVAWKPLKEAMQPILKFDAPLERNAELVLTDEGAALEGDLFHAILTATENNTSAELLRVSNDLTLHVQTEAARRAAQLRIVQITGICLALLNFFIILFHFIRKLRSYDAEVEAARKETDDILDTVTEGLFLLDANMKIGSQYSRNLEQILRCKDLQGINLFTILRNIVPESTLKIARDYVDLFFGERVHQNLINDLNPLDQVEVHFEDRCGGYQTRYLGFEFRRVLVNETLSHLLVTVMDITDRVALERALEQQQEKSQQQLDMLLDILHIEPRILNEFLRESENRVSLINAILREPSRNQSSHHDKLDAIARHVHALKGESAALGMSSIHARTHDLEETIVALKKQREIQGNDFLSFTIMLDDVLKHIHSIGKMINKLVDFRGAFGKVHHPPDHPVDPDAERRAQPRTNTTDLLHNLVARVAEEEGKRVRLVCNGLDSPQLPEHYRKAIKDMAVQLIRNGIAHGIEAPDERLAVHKAQQGRIVLRLTGDADSGYELLYRDDGRGLPVDRIRQAAVDKGFVTADQVEKMDKRSILSLIFRRGFSTSASAHGHSGRGIGMDVIRNLVSELNGKVRMSTSEGEYTSFQFKLPAQSGDVFRAA